jgi:uncharacterized protein YcbX
VIARASLDHLNDRLAAKGAASLPMNRFRPNLVLDGLAAHDETTSTRSRSTASC